MSKKHRCFPLQANDGTTIVVRGDPNMSEKAKDALRALMEAAENRIMTQEYGPNWREQFPVVKIEQGQD